MADESTNLERIDEMVELIGLLKQMIFQSFGEIHALRIAVENLLALHPDTVRSLRRASFDLAPHRPEDSAVLREFDAQLPEVGAARREALKRLLDKADELIAQANL